ncbi:MAG: M23 family metallopeptidase [Bacteroidales bacterium]|nr:M23 family metallopeptidase [Bacteroidales bacterium]
MKLKEYYGKVKQFLKHIAANWKTQYRLTFKYENNHDERLSLLLTPQRIFVIIVTAAVILIALTALIISVTPLKYYIPGYTTREEHQLYMDVSAQVDSLSTLSMQNQQFLDNLYNIINDNITDDENAIIAEDENTGQHQLSDRNKEEQEAMNEVDNQANLLLSNQLKTEDDNSKLPVTHRADISNFNLRTPAEGALVGIFDLASNHYGIDIQNKKHTLITCVSEGIIIYSGFDPGSGNTLIIQHPGNIISIYKHCDVLLKSVGTKVSTGEAIAKMGNSGNEGIKAPHLHFELWYNGFPIDPLEYLVIGK